MNVNTRPHAGHSTLKSRLLMALAIVTPIAFLASMPWLRDQPDTLVYILAGIASVTVLVSSMLLAIINDRQSDEWNRTAARFSSHWGFVAGGALVALLLNLPAFREMIARIATQLNGGPVNDKLIVMTFTAGFGACMIAQMIFVLIFSVAWRFWMLRKS